MTKTLTFKYCWVHLSPGYTETIFHDGTRVTAVPENSDTYREKARRYGYGEDIAALSREHEVLHTLLAERLRDTGSPALWAVAHGQQEQVAPLWEQEEEEALVLAFQSYLNGAPPGPELDRLRATGSGGDHSAPSLESLRDEALALLRP